MTDKRKVFQQLATQVQQACIQAALEGYEHAGISGLCEEGRLEVAISEMRMVDLAKLIESAINSPDK